MRSLTVGELLGRIPVQAVPFEVLEGGRVVLLRPKFVDRRMAWLQRLLPRPEFRVRLDARGSFIWTALDGVRTGQGVCDAVRAQFGEEAEPVEERTVAFLHQLVSGKFALLTDRPA